VKPSSKNKAKLGFLLGGLAVIFLFVLFQLSRHPETAVLLVSLPDPAALSCNLRCVGIAPFLQVLGEGLKALLLISMSAFFVYALYRTVRRILRTWSFIERAGRSAFSASSVPPLPFLENVTVFENRLPWALTAGFFKPKILISSGLIKALDENELRAVVLHETHHQESKDPLKGLFVSFISDFLFFLPVSRLLKNVYDLTSEMSADARSIERQADPLDLAGSLLKVQKLSGPAASWFFDPTTERAKHLLGEPSKIRLPFKKIFLTVVFLAISTAVALIPVRKSVTAMFVDHDKTCVLNASHR